MSDSSDHVQAVSRLLRVMAALREESGCPWDRRQTHRSLIPYLIEEAYEVVDAIEGGKEDDALREELGDLLFQVVFHARIAEEAGRFDFHDVARSLAEKLVERHPHVFDGQPAESAEALRRTWHERKTAARESALDGVPRALPALQRAAKVSGAAAQAGFEWHRQEQILEKCREELEEFRRALAERDAGLGSGTETKRSTSELEMELGDLLFAVVQSARWQGIDPETALRRATDKFIARFRWMEARLRERGGTAVPEEWQALWTEAKAAVPG
jgi:MazG family protein